ncbi:MAG TPA: hypothetical protein VFN78_11850 [Ktedonobacterales bacterium]|nr:hypothetical protein [Ktedonobacterales bacterium]
MENIVSFIGAFLKHVIGVLLLCWRRMLRAGLVAFALGVILVLLIAVISTGQAYPGALALAVALIFGGVLAYGVALTVFIEELLLGVVDLIHLLEGDVKAVAHLTETVAEREVGEVTKGLGRLIGLPLGKRPAPPPPPTLPALPRYPAARPSSAHPASAPGARVAPSAAPTPRREAIARDAAIAGAAALASTAVASAVSHHQAAQQPTAQTQTQAQPAATPPTDSTLAAESAAQAAMEAPTGAPVRADRLPRIGWTYEHEAIRPVRSAEPPDTLAELADVAVVGAGIAGAARVASDAAPEPAAAESPAEPPDALDVAVVSATALGPYGQVADPAPISASDASASPQATTDAAKSVETSVTSNVSDVSGDVPALEDERLAEPEALAIPEPETPPGEPLVPEPETPPVPYEAWPAHAEMLTPAPATTPLPLEAMPLDPAMLTPAPSTVPLAVDDEPAPESHATAAAEAATLADAPSYPSPERAESAPHDFAPVVDAPQDAAAPVAPDAPVAPEEVAASAGAPEATPEPEGVPEEATVDPGATQPEIPSARSVFSRITRPVVDVESTLDALHRIRSSSGPRASAPESGLWERLSQALIDRSGAPSSPFAAPQNRPASTDAHTPSEDEESPQG